MYYKLLMNVLLSCFIMTYNIQSNTVIQSFKPKETQQWVFGHYLRMDFKGDSLTSDSMYTRESTSSISKSNGRLLLATDGVSLFHYKTFQPFVGDIDTFHTNVFNTYQDPTYRGSSSQTLISKKNDSLYIIFITCSWENRNLKNTNKGLTYSVYNINTKNFQILNYQLESVSTEKITSIYNHDMTDEWIIFMKYNSSLDTSFLDYGILKLSSLPVCDSTDLYDRDNTIIPINYYKSKLPSTDNYEIGQLNAFSGGFKIANSSNDGYIEIVNIDNKEGKIDTNTTTLLYLEGNVYGVEFNNDSKHIYTSITDSISSKILKINIKDKTKEIILETNHTREINGNIINTTKFGQLQIGYDNKIYVQETNYQRRWILTDLPKDYFNLWRIDQTDNVEKVIYNLDSLQYTQIGLPNLNQTYYYNFESSIDTIGCNTIVTNISSNVQDDETIIYYYFNDILIDSNINNFTYIYKEDGMFKFEIINRTSIFKDSLEVTYVNYDITHNLNNIYFIYCDSINVYYDINNIDSLIWNNNQVRYSTENSIQDSITFFSSGLYNVTFFNKCDTSTIYINIIDITDDIIFTYSQYCNDIIVDTNIKNLRVYFEDSLIVENYEFEIFKSGYYKLIYENNYGCMFDTLLYLNYTSPTVQEYEYTVCEFIEINLPNNSTNILWGDNFEGNKRLLREGVYTVSFNIDNCKYINIYNVSLFLIDELNLEDINFGEKDIFDTKEITFDLQEGYVYQLINNKEFVLDSNKITYTQNNPSYDSDILYVKDTACNNEYFIFISGKTTMTIYFELQDTVLNIGEEYLIKTKLYHDYTQDLTHINLNGNIHYNINENVLFTNDNIKSFDLNQREIDVRGLVLLHSIDQGDIIQIEDVYHNYDRDLINIIIINKPMTVEVICIQDLRQITIVDIEYKVYPNPSNDVFNLKFLDHTNTLISIKMYDINSKLLYDNLIDTTLFKETKLISKSNGVYILILKYLDKQEIIKLIKY